MTENQLRKLTPSQLGRLLAWAQNEQSNVWKHQDRAYLRWLEAAIGRRLTALA